MIGLAALLSAFGVMIVVTLVRAYCLSKAWVWLAVPILHVPSFPVGQVFALLLLLLMIKGVRYDDKTPEDPMERIKQIGKALGYSVLFPWIYLLEAWIVKGLIF